MLKKYDAIINDNGDVWTVDSVHKDGSVTISFEGGGGDDTLTYSEGEIMSMFKKLPEGDYSDVSYIDPKLAKTIEIMGTRRVSRPTAKKTRRSYTSTSLGGMRG